MKKLPQRLCTGCMACSAICPKKAITFKVMNGFFKRCVSDDCVRCGLCEAVCPILHPANKSKPIDVVAASLTNRDVLKRSSSGGVFAGVASVFLSRGGAVCGAIINRTEVFHEISDCDFEMFQGSKYLQSRTDQIFLKVENALKTNQCVLFTGTPCQVAAIQSFVKLRKLDLTNLFTIELICHGVPSFSLIDMYGKQFAAKIEKIISFRDKDEGWSPRYATTIQLQDGSIIRDANSSFTKAFSGFKMLRRSCYDCPFKDINRSADLTIGDLWGNKNQHNYNDGLSLVLVNSKKGLDLMMESSNLFSLRSIKKEDYWLQGNPNLVKHYNPYKYHPFRIFLNWNIKHLGQKTLTAFYCGVFDHNHILQKLVHAIDAPYDKLLNYERVRKCKKVLSDFFD